ncbi:MAG: cysteine hydrolase [Lachnospiraceae bacterium]|nr:cysteine hydrolase [Lachnospiraceae bacterium]
MDKKRALIVVDMQKDFVTGALKNREAEEITAGVGEKVENALREGVSVFFTLDTHNEDYMDSEEGKNLPVPHCIRGTEGWMPVPALEKYRNSKEVVFFEKPGFGSFELMEKLRTEQYEEIELVGLCTDICVISNAVGARTALPGAHIIVDAACCAGVTPESHDTACSAMKAMQVEILNQGKEPWRKAEG